jgi:hypothetical protein
MLERAKEVRRCGKYIVVGLAVYALPMPDVFSKLLQALAYHGTFVVAWVGSR